MAHPQERTDIMDRCITEAANCHRVVLDTLGHCLETGGDHVAADHIRTLLDCGDFTQLTADAVSRGSLFIDELADVCADQCDACAASCDNLGEHPQLKECMEVCARCGEVCRLVAAELATAA